MKSIEHPYANLTGGHWYKGNLHAHTTRSDGQRGAQEVIDDYAACGSAFLMISDHDVFTSAEDYAAFDSRGMTLIPGNEVTRNGPHLLHVNADRLVKPDVQRQQVLSDINANTASFAIVNHPNWQQAFDHCTIHQLREWIGYAGIEIYNGVIGRLDGSPYATNKWDMLLAAGRRLWGYAHDDSHRAGECGLGWNMVYAPDKNIKSLVTSLRDGRFYASTGVVIRKIEVDGLRIRIETENAQRITALQQIGKRFATVDDKSIEVEVPANATYVRFECWGAGEQFAWTNPFFITGE